MPQRGERQGEQDTRVGRAAGAAIGAALRRHLDGRFGAGVLTASVRSGLDDLDRLGSGLADVRFFGG